MNDRFSNQRLLIMAKAPIPGEAKTRLIPSLGAEGAAQLHQQLVLRLLDVLIPDLIAPLQLWCSPDETHPFFQACVRRYTPLSSQAYVQHYTLSLHRQQGDDLGQRMAHALVSALSDARAAIVIGCDIPELGPTQVTQACQWLEQGSDAVLGPSEDGGYYLLGLRKMAEPLFADIPWGSAQVAEHTRERLRGLGWQWRELETLWDVDRPQDWVRARNAGWVGHAGQSSRHAG